MLGQGKRKCAMEDINDELKSVWRNFGPFPRILALATLWRWNLRSPPAIHDFHNDPLLTPEKMKIPTEWRSDYANFFGLNVGSTTEIVLDILVDKHHYLCHCKILNFYLHHGLKVTKRHRVMKFQQSKWLGADISKSTKMRKLVSNDFEKKPYNLMLALARLWRIYGHLVTCDSLHQKCKLKLPSNELRSKTSKKLAMVLRLFPLELPP